jgi:colicin import membrane protein
MNAATATAPPFPVDRFARRDTAPSFAMALAMHGALVLGMWVSVQWHTSASAPAVAELWELTAPPEPPVPEPVPVPAPEPAPAPEPPPPAAQPEADIALQAKKAKEVAQAEEQARAKKKREEEKRRAERDRKEQEAKAEKRQQEELARLTSQAQSARTPTPAMSGEISREYGARIQGAVRSHLSYAVPEGVSKDVYAEFHVELLPTGEQAAEPVLVKSSGLAGYDEAARRAILRTDPFPRRDDGTVPRTLQLKMYPADQ